MEGYKMDLKDEEDAKWEQECKEYEEKRAERESRLVIKIRTALDELLLVNDCDDATAKPV